MPLTTAWRIYGSEIFSTGQIAVANVHAAHVNCSKIRIVSVDDNALNVFVGPIDYNKGTPIRLQDVDSSEYFISTANV